MTRTDSNEIAVAFTGDDVVAVSGNGNPAAVEAIKLWQQKNGLLHFPHYEQDFYDFCNQAYDDATVRQIRLEIWRSQGSYETHHEEAAWKSHEDAPDKHVMSLKEISARINQKNAEIRRLIDEVSVLHRLSCGIQGLEG